MKRTTSRSSNKNTPKRENAETVAEKLGVSPSAVYGWRAKGSFPKNPILRVRFIRIEQGKSKRVSK